MIGSPLSLEIVLNRIAKATSRKEIVGDCYGGMKFYGKVSKESFTIRAITKYLDVSKPIMIGSVQEGDSQTDVLLELHKDKRAQWFGHISFLLAVLVSLSDIVFALVFAAMGLYFGYIRYYSLCKQHTAVLTKLLEGWIEPGSLYNEDCRS